MSPISADNTTSIAFSEAPITPEDGEIQKTTTIGKGFETKPEPENGFIATIGNQDQTTSKASETTQDKEKTPSKEEITTLGDYELYKEQEQIFSLNVTANESKP